MKTFRREHAYLLINVANYLVLFDAYRIKILAERRLFDEFDFVFIFRFKFAQIIKRIEDFRNYRVIEQFVEFVDALQNAFDTFLGFFQNFFDGELAHEPVFFGEPQN